MHRLILFLIALTILAVPAAATAEDQPTYLTIDVPPVALMAGDSGGVAYPQTNADTGYLRANSSDSITVVYKGSFPAQAKAAFEYALDIWRGYLDTRVPITVEANWKSLPTHVLGQATPNGMVALFPGAPTAMFYAPALANQFAGYDLDPKKPDILADFSSKVKNFYFGTDGRPPVGQEDFVSVVLHEFTHGIGFTGTADVSATTATIGFSPKYTQAAAFDAFIVNKDGKPLFGGFPEKSADLRAQMLSGKLYWNGNHGVAATPGTAPRLYAPSTWDDGSSVYHLDEDIYVPGDPDALMSPILDDGEAEHQLGPIVRGILVDLGWSLVPMDPAYLYFLSQPGGGEPGGLLTVQPQVAVLNAIGYTLTSDSKTRVTLELINAANAQLTCNGGLDRVVKSGVASFSGCRVDSTAPDAVIVARAESLPVAQSGPLAIFRRGGFHGALPGVSRD